MRNRGPRGTFKRAFTGRRRLERCRLNVLSLEQALVVEWRTGRANEDALFFVHCRRDERLKVRQPAGHRVVTATQNRALNLRLTRRGNFGTRVVRLVRSGCYVLRPVFDFLLFVATAEYARILRDQCRIDAQCARRASARERRSDTGGNFHPCASPIAVHGTLDRETGTRQKTQNGDVLDDVLQADLASGPGGCTARRAPEAGNLGNQPLAGFQKARALGLCRCQ